MEGKAHHLKVGSFKCIIFNDGTLGGEGETYGLNCIYIETGRNRILIGNGCGDGFQATTGHLVKNMEGEGIKPADITTIIFDHGHIDHVLGTTDKEGKPVFTNARYIMSGKEWEYIEAPPGDNETQNFFYGPARKNLLPLKGRFTLVEDKYKAFPGIRLMAAYGHTPGNSMVELTSGGERLLCIGDIIHSKQEFTDPRHCAAFDVTPEEAIKTRAKILAKLAGDGTLVFACHFTFPGLGYIRDKNGILGWEAI